MKRHWKYSLAVPALAALAVVGCATAMSDDGEQSVTKLDRQINKHAQRTLAEGRHIFRFDTSATRPSGAIRLSCIKPSKEHASAVSARASARKRR